MADEDQIAVLRFGEFEARIDSGELSRDGVVVRIQDLPFRLLVVLAERPGVIVTRQEIGRALWGDDTHVALDAGVNTAVAKLREALADTAEAPRFVETVPKRGYRFLVPVERLSLTAPRAANRGAAGHADAGPGAAIVRDAAGTGAASGAPPSRSGRVAVASVAVLLLAGVIVLVGLASSASRAARAPVRVAVALFDNETGDPALDRLAQVLTDSAVVRLTSNARLAVIGNAAVLRSDRPFRDLERIREELDADLIVIGQVQRVDDAVSVLTHLIRSSDQAHVWVARTPVTADGEAVLDAVVSTVVSEAVASEVARPAVR